MNERISSLQTNLQTSADYESMLEVLKKLNYISNTNILKLKGQIAAIFGSGKELLLTELIYQNLIDNLTPSEIAALISSIIFQGKRFDDEINNENEKKEITPALYRAKQQLSMTSKKKKIFFNLKIFLKFQSPVNLIKFNVIIKFRQILKMNLILVLCH
jgi:superfamily II RNA helicase